MSPKKKQASTSFAKDFAKLEAIVERFENEEDIDLDKGLKDFEEGLQLAEKLKKNLDHVENTIETLKSKYGVDSE